ncbi:tRNA 5-methylaminomethyl-2-thiouridine biosynthesis bifunctional protein MnmC [Dyadobacter sp. CECT 9275]|uniref:tRNA 5-methylaminomethyl-2-thiouridine biosynthesis bifunctional protein MnmC n=1 Tax=Dyadobacter helix TaxID=2822344 RepID=A0A916J8E1_9BACT|nr:FAD-dependent oxidoreductase [Dyadobacter sp. CECT 9275]CAG4993297.1 tRNA 5-methylaminomethyl-2-thiouridine biosynthesis bifunctional protein MnmC [Dyadobacter sp. CECT 9275]
MTNRGGISVDYDYLIVGQGIGGTALAWHLHRLGKKIRVVGDSSLPSSSRVAAGIFNPLTGKKLVKTWLADQLFPYASEFYASLENKLNIKLVYPLPVYRPYRSIEEQNTYLAQTANPGIAQYITSQTDDLLPLDYISNPYGGLKVGQSGWVDLPLLLDQSKIYFEKEGIYTEERFAAEDLIFTSDTVEWNGKTFNKVILCQGVMALENSFFNWLPFSPVKGEILDIAVENILKPYIVNQGIFILPLSKDSARVGATYSWDPLDWETTDAAKNELADKIRSLLNVPFTVTKQNAGLRPSVKDRRPLIGIHPEENRVGIFNGLGTKGVTLAPFFANEFAQHLEHGKELNPLVNIKRYFSLYFH